MKPHPRIRKAIKWGGAAVTVLLVVVWIGSGWVYMGGWGTRRGAGLHPGGVLLVDLGPHPEPHTAGWTARWSSGFSSWKWWFHSDSKDDFRIAFAPLWPVVSATLLPTLIAWRLDFVARRRERAHLCPKCRYDRTGLGLSAKCPECGAAPAAR
jgi:hypothetical protein